MSRISPILTAPSEILSAPSAEAAVGVASRQVSAAAIVLLFIAILQPVGSRSKAQLPGIRWSAASPAAVPRRASHAAMPPRRFMTSRRLMGCTQTLVLRFRISHHLAAPSERNSESKEHYQDQCLLVRLMNLNFLQELAGT